MRKLMMATLVVVLTIGFTGNIVSADPGLPLPRIPIGGDQDGSEIPFILRAPGFDLLTDVQNFKVPGNGPVDITFDFVFREAAYNNEFGFFRVDNAAGQIDGVDPGAPVYMSLALDRAAVVFPSGSTAFTPDATVSMNGGDILVFFIVQNNTLANLRANNPTNDPGRSPQAFFSMDVLNPDNFDHFVGFRNLTDDITQFGFEDLTGGGDQDYDDIVYNVKTVLRPSPSVERRDVVFVRGLNSEGHCNGANWWVKHYLSSEEGRSFFGNIDVGEYLNYSYAGGDYTCPMSESEPEPEPEPFYTKADTCDGVTEAAQELRGLINGQATAKVTIVAHSMGGLVAAYLVASQPDWAKEHIASVVTFDSPVKGLSEAVIYNYSLLPSSACKLGNVPPSLSESLVDLADTSSVVSLAVQASQTMETIPFYHLDATQLDPAGLFITRNKTRLEDAKPFHLFRQCGAPFALPEPDCEPPLAVDDDHFSVWKRRFDEHSQHDKGRLVGCAVTRADDCAFLILTVNQGMIAQTQVEIAANAERVRFTSSFGSIVRMTLVSPNGTVYGPDGAGPVAAYAADAVSEVYEIVDPAPGLWTIELLGVDVAPEGEDVSLALLVLESSDPGFEIPPAADAGGPYTAEVGETINFNGIGSFDADGTIVLYEWDFQSDGVFDFNSTDPFASYVYSTELVGTVTLQVTDNDGHTGTGTATVEVSVSNQPPTADPNGPYMADEGAEIIFDGTGSSDPDGENLDFSWDFGDGTVGDGSIIAHVYPDDGDYIVTLTVTDPAGLSDTQITTATVANLPPIVETGPDQTISEGNTANLDSATFADVGVLDTHTATIDWGDGIVETGTISESNGSGTVSGSHVYGDDGTYTVTVAVCDDDGACDQDSFGITVNNVAPSLTLDISTAITFAGGDAFLGRKGVEQLHAASVTDPGSDDLTFNWSFGATTTYFNNDVGPDPFPSPDGVFPFWVTDTVSVTFGESGVYTVAVEAADDDGGTDAASLSKLIMGDSECTLSQGFWKRQFSERGRHQIDDDTLEAYLDIVNFTSAVFSEQVSATTIQEARQVMEVSDPTMRDNAGAQLLAAWLNFVQGSVDWDELIDTDDDGVGDTPFHQVVSGAEAILLNPGATHQELEHAKDLAEAVNLHDEGNPVCSGG